MYIHVDEVKVIFVEYAISIFTINTLAEDKTISWKNMYEIRTYNSVWHFPSVL